MSMKHSILWRAAALVTIALALGTQGLAGPAEQTRLGGQIDDYTGTADPAAAWHVSGDWALRLKGDSGKGTFAAALSMVHSANPAPAAHTHHVTLSDAEVTPLANGFRIAGLATITSNGNVAGFSGSPIDVQVTGGNGLLYSNVAVTFGGAAAAHFGDLPIHGTVTAGRQGE